MPGSSSRSRIGSRIGPLVVAAAISSGSGCGCGSSRRRHSSHGYSLSHSGGNMPRSSGFFRFGQGINNDSGNSKHRYAGNYRHFAMLFACSPASLADEAQRGRGFEFTCKHNSCSCSCAPQCDKAWSNIATVAHQPNKPSTQGLHRKLCKPLPYL